MPTDASESAFFAVLRLIGFLLLLRAVYVWFSLTGVFPPALHPVPFNTHTDLELALVVASSVGCMIAGVGLWLLAPWGAVMWLVMVGMDAVLVSVVPDYQGVRYLVLGLNTGFVAIYLGMALRVRRLMNERKTI